MKCIWISYNPYICKHTALAIYTLVVGVWVKTAALGSLVPRPLQAICRGVRRDEKPGEAWDEAVLHFDYEK